MADEGARGGGCGATARATAFCSAALDLCLRPHCSDSSRSYRLISLSADSRETWTPQPWGQLSMQSSRGITWERAGLWERGAKATGLTGCQAGA